MKCWRRSPFIFQYYARRHNSSAVPIVLRPYQEECLDACTAAIASGSTRIGVSLPTGSGKTTVFISLLSRILPPPEKQGATRSLIIVNTIELARQSAAQVARLFPHWTVEIEQGVKHQATGLADVTVATYQTLNNEQRALKFDPNTLKAIIVDEAHHAASPSYRRLLARFHPEIDVPGLEAVSDHKVPIVGFSATFGRHDGLALSSVFERIVYHRELSEMMLEEWLCKVRLTSVKADLDLHKVSINPANGDFNPTSLASVMNTDAINKLVVKSWILHAPKEKSTLVFCVNIAHVDALTETFRSSGIDARSISGKTPADQRKVTVQAFKDGEFPVLVNCAILTEGADIPNIDCIILARPTRSRNLFSQMIGRGMRLSPSTGKEGCRVIDFVDSHNRLGQELVVSPSLLGMDPNMIGETPEKRPPGNSEGTTGFLQEIAEPTFVTFTDHGDLFLENMLPGPRQSPIHSISQLAWVVCGNDLYILELLRQGQIRIKKEEGLFVVHHNPVVKSKSGMSFVRPRQILTTDNINAAINGTATFLERVLFKDSARDLSALRRSAKWRAEPATNLQIAFVLKKWSEKLSPGMKEEEKIEILSMMTKGAIADTITRLRNGSLGHLNKLSSTITKKAQKEAKEQMRRSRETVNVGLLAA